MVSYCLQPLLTPPTIIAARGRSIAATVTTITVATIAITATAVFPPSFASMVLEAFIGCPLPCLLPLLLCATFLLTHALLLPPLLLTPLPIVHAPVDAIQLAHQHYTHVSGHLTRWPPWLPLLNQLHNCTCDGRVLLVCIWWVFCFAWLYATPCALQAIKCVQGRGRGHVFLVVVATSWSLLLYLLIHSGSNRDRPGGRTTNRRGERRNNNLVALIVVLQV